MGLCLKPPMNKKINIAIDGHSSCGKGTLAKQLAEALQYQFVDSGAMYRAVTWYLIENEISTEHISKNPELLQAIDISFQYNEDDKFFETHLNNVNVEPKIRGIEVSQLVSKVSTLSEVRRFLVAKQQELIAKKGVVMDGRDIGTVVIPDAELKIFMTAESRIRAKRRFDEMTNKGISVSYEDILNNITLRDHIDSTRDDSPLKRADDAILLDNSNMTREQQFKVALSWAKGVISSIS
jgi:CMP/dCMP kinase